MNVSREAREVARHVQGHVFSCASCGRETTPGNSLCEDCASKWGDGT